MKIDLTDQIALVTGSAHRVGKTIAVELAKAGVHIIVHYHSTDANIVRETIQGIKSYGVSAFAVQADIGTEEGVQTVFDSIKTQFGRLDILVNSAAVFNKNTLLETSLKDWNTSLAVNLTAPFLCTQSAGKLMQDTGGTIINICDFGSVNPWPERVDHNISKAGLLMLTKVSAVSLGKFNIRVNGVLPGPVSKIPSMTNEQWERSGQRSPLNRTGQADDVARSVVYLAGEDYITGTILHVNGAEHLT